jgi:hypothetical protein
MISRSLAILDGDAARAIELAREALVVAEQTGDEDSASNALNTIGLAAVSAGDASGVEDLERAVERAEQAGAFYVQFNALNNLANALWFTGRLTEGSARIRECRAQSERYGFTTALQWNDAELILDAYYCGELEELLDGANRFLAEVPEGMGYQERATLATRAAALLARGQVDAAVADSEKALATLRATGWDAQLGPYILTAATMASRAAGRETEADELLDELLTRGFSEEIYEIPLHLVELERGDDYLRLTEERPGHLWREAGRATASGEFVRAAELYGGMGARYAEAWAALLAAEGGDTSRLESALAYFEEQRATPYVQRCHALMQASA